MKYFRVLGSLALAFTAVVVGFVLTLGGAVSWGQVPSTNDTSDANGNTGGGFLALDNNTGLSNTAYGFQALSYGNTGSYSTAVGDHALRNNSSGGGNTAVGAYALVDNTAGSDNTASGYKALFSNTTGAENTAIGTGALRENFSGSQNTASGDGALRLNVYGSGNTATGYSALEYNETGNKNTAVGFEALARGRPGGDENTAIGSHALNYNSGSANTASGHRALYSNITGGVNTASGTQALELNSTGNANTANGTLALSSNTTGDNNTAIGTQALAGSTGNNNIAVGQRAGINLTGGDNNIYLGNTGGAFSGTESATMRLGEKQTRTFIAGILGTPLGGGSPKVMYISSSGQVGVLASSTRYKRDIHDMRDNSQQIYQLRPVTFRYQEDPHGQQQYGLIAEEVAKVYPELVTTGTDGKVESVQYHELIAMLLNELQRQQKTLERQQQELTELRALVGSRLRQ
jgi:hypothetical protein